MIRINLLGTERKQAKKPAASFDVGQRLTVACSLILVGALVGIGWWYWSLNNETVRLAVNVTMSSAGMDGFYYACLVKKVS